MSHLIASLAWCWLQVLLVASAAIGLSLLMLRRSPTAGATIAWSGVIAALTLAGLAIVPFPARAMQRKLSELAASHSHVKRTAISTPKPELQTESDASGEAGFQAVLNGPLFRKLLESLRTSESAVVRNHGAVRWALGVAAIGFAIGLLRLMSGLMAIAALRRRSTVVPDCGVSELLADLLPGLSLRQLPQLRETGDLDSAAVVGWWRPAIVLPADWREWSLAELKAVLAHELAHIARHDALWRLVATFTVALHWGQPLMHWLRRQLLLAQELAADELAAAAMGSKQEYLQALAKLALRQDSRPVATPSSALVPVFSGFLLRRMVMLRAKDGSLHRDWRLLMQGTALGLVGAITLLATAIRGLAEPPETQSDGSIRVAKATDVKLRPAVAGTEHLAETAMFQRPAFDISKMAFGPQGGFLVRFGEIYQQPRFAKSARAKDEWLAKLWTDTYAGAEAPPFSIKDIEYVAGDLNIFARYVAPPKEEKNPHPHQLLAGSKCGFIRFRKPVDEVLAWLKRTPGAEVKQHGDVSYVAFSIAILGPPKTCVCRYDDHTLLWGGGESVLAQRLDALATASEPPAWHNAWKEVEGGLLTAVAAESEYKDPPATVVDESDEFTRTFFAKTGLKSFGADWQADEGGNVSFKFHLRFENEVNARAIEALIRQWLALMEQEPREEASDAGEEKGKAFSEALIAMLQQARIETRETEKGWQIDVQLNGPIDIEFGL